MRPSAREQSPLMDDPLSSVVADAAQRLRAGGLVAFPTETVYGLGADALNEQAVRRVFALKGRPAGNPLIVHVADADMARGVVADWLTQADALARAFWPGPLTIVLGRGACVPAVVTGGGETVAVRCPDHPLALALLRAFGGPIVGPSANPSGIVSPTTAGHVRTAFAEAVARGELLVLDGGPCRAGIESTVVSLASRPLRVFRRGVVSAEEIERVIGERVEVGEANAAEGGHGPMPAPGLLPRHYAPRSPARLFDPADWPEVLDAVPSPAVVLTHQRSRVVPPPHTLIRLPMDVLGYAASLYSSLHEADALAPAVILIERPGGDGPVWDAVRDRLDRACSGG